jgi:5-methylcytosine-specific restriction endonuclease McrA
MTRRFRGDYPADFEEIARRCKERAGWKCERCGHDNDATTGHVLTVHHLDGDKSNNADWNLAALCQRCHLRIQGKIDFAQAYMLEHTPWMEPHVRGFLAERGLLREGCPCR